MTPAEESKYTKAVEDSASTTKEGREDNAFLGFIFVIVGRCCIESHCISNQVKSIHQKVELLLVEIGSKDCPKGDIE